MFMKMKMWVALVATACCGLIAGADEVTLPDGYTRLEYIQATGSQWIHTHFAPRCTDRIELKLNVPAGQLPFTQALYCARSSGQENSLCGFIIWGTTGISSTRFDKKKATTPSTFAFEEETDCTIVADYATGRVTANGEEICLMPDATYPAGSPMSLFASHNGSYTFETGTMGNFARYRLYWFRVYDCYGKLLREYIPVCDTSAPEGSQGQFGLWETQTKTYLTTQADDPFIPGVPQKTVVLSEDADWRDLGEAATRGKTIDLNGHKLTVSYLAPPASITDTSTGNPGELHLDLARGLTNRFVDIQGNLRLVKEGEGMLCLWRERQLFTGGFEVANGYARTGYEGSLVSIGTTNGVVRIASGATFDTYSHIDFDYTFELDGGTLTNAISPASAWGKHMISNVCVTADSVYDIGDTYYGLISRGYAPSFIDLGGHTLAVRTTMAGNFYLANTTTTAGTIVQDGRLEFYHDPSDLRASTLVVNGFLRVNSNCANVLLGNVIVNTAEADTAGAVASYPNPLLVYGTLRPNTDYFRGYALQDGAALDLSGRTGLFRTRGLAAGTAEVFHTITFATNATITVKLAGRAVASGEKLIEWATPPENVTFVPDADSASQGITLVQSETGVFVGGAAAETLVDLACWTNEKGDNNVSDPANWTCRNPAGQALEGALPGPASIIRIEGDVAFQAPPGTVLTFATFEVCDAALTADCDWRGLGAIKVTGTLDLKGHELRCAGVDGTGAIVDNSFDLTDAATAASRITCPSEIQSGTAANLFNNNFTRNGTDAGYRVLMANSKLPFTCTYDFEEPTVIDAYGVTVGPNDQLVRAPKAWVLEGSVDGSAWDQLDVRTDETFWSTHDYRRYTFENTVAYRYYRLTISAPQDATDGYMELVQLEYGRQGATGTLRLDVPEGAVAVNTGVRFAGNFALVKEGLGTYQPSVEKQLNLLGADIRAGRVVFGVAQDPLGVGTVKVAAGATIDMNGYYTANTAYRFETAGTITQTHDAWTIASRSFGTVALTGDATFGGNNYAWGTPPNYQGALALNGHTLRVESEDLITLIDRPVLDTGTLELVRGRLQIQDVIAWSNVNVKVDADAVLKLTHSLKVKDLDYQGAAWQTDVSDGVRVWVYGTMRPGALYPALRFEGGSTVDLSQMTGPWDANGEAPKGDASGVGVRTYTKSGDVWFNPDNVPGAITINLAGRTLAEGDMLIRWAVMPPVGVQFVFDDETAQNGYTPVVTPIGLYYGMPANDPVVATARWTGEAGDGNVLNPANWFCANRAGNEVTGVPGDQSVVTIAGNVDLQVPAGSTFAPAQVTFGTCKLTADCDWRGLDTTALAGDIDLDGHKLYVSKLGGTARIFDVAGYDFLSYLKSTGPTDGTKTAAGKSQWINTNFVPAYNDRIEMGVNFNEINGNHTLWCARTDQNNTFTAFMLGSSFRFDHVNKGTTLGPTVVANKDYTIIADGQSCVVTINDISYTTKMVSGGAYTVGGPLTIFYSYSGSGNVNSSPAHPGRYKLYYLRVYGADGTLKRNFVPARRRSDGKLGVVDRVTGGFYMNAGEGEFEAGPLIEEGENVGVPGELHMDVPEGETSQNDTVALDGSACFVKEGAGTFVANKQYQSYWGGTVVKAGTITTLFSGSGSSTHSFKYAYYGSTGSTITLEEGGTLDNQGNYDAGVYRLVLAGGRPTNTGCDMTQTNWGGLGNFELQTNTVFATDYQTIFNYGSFTNRLNGQTFSIDLAQPGVNIALGGYFADGAVRIKLSDGYVKSAAPLYMETADFILEGAALWGSSEMVVRDYWAGESAQPYLGVVNMYVNGRFTPASDKWYGCTLRNGATLDLTHQTGEWPVRCPSSMGVDTVTFADGATIAVELKGRKLRNGDRVVVWGAKPEGVTFAPTSGTRREGYRVVPLADGLYVFRGLTVFLR